MSISRRTALATGAAAITTAAITAPLAIKAGATKAALAGDPAVVLSQQLRAASQAWFDAIDAFDEAGHRVGYNWVYYDRGSVEVETSNGCYGWNEEEIRQAAEDGRIAPDKRDAALAELKQRECEAQEARRELGIESLYQEREHWKARFWDLRAQLLDTPATTPRGVLAKLRGFYHDEEIAAIDDGLEGLPGEYATSIYRDLERLSGEARP